MAILNSISWSPLWIGCLQSGSGAAASVTLTNAYVQNTSGDAFGIRFLSRSTDTIDAVWVYVTAISGAPVLAATLIGENTGFVARPATATTLDTSTAADTPTAGTWCKITFGTPYTPVVGEILWIVVHKTSGTTCDIRVGTNAVFFRNNSENIHLVCETTSNGYTTNGGAQLEAPFLIKQGSSYFGQPLTQQATVYASNQLERGIKFTSPVTCKLSGFISVAGSTNVASAHLYASSGVPGGTTLNDWDMDSDTGQTTNDAIGAKIFSSDVTLSQGSTYLFTLRFTVNSNFPVVGEIENYASYTTEFDAIRDANPWLPYSVIDGGAGSFTSQKQYFPGFVLLVSDFPSVGHIASRQLLGM